MSEIIGILKLQPMEEDESWYSKRVPGTEYDEMSVDIQSRFLKPEQSPAAAFNTQSQQDSMSFQN